MFDYRRGWIYTAPVNDPDRYRVTLTTSGKPTLIGWWGSLATATTKYSAVIGKHGRPGSTVELAERRGDSYRVLKTWPPTASEAADHTE